MTLYRLRNLVHLPVEEGEEQYYGYGDYSKTDILTKGYVFSTSKRKAGAWFKRERKELWGGRKPFLNGSSACPQFWVEEVDAEELPQYWQKWAECLFIAPAGPAKNGEKTSDD